MSVYEKRGYLNREFQIFHLTDTPKEKFNFHYHDFDKILILLSKQARYAIEGKNYLLEPLDVVYVNQGAIHRPDILQNASYERLIIYISPQYLPSLAPKAGDLTQCLRQALKQQANVLRLHGRGRSSLEQLVRRLTDSVGSQDFAADFYRQLLFGELMVLLNRESMNDTLEYLNTASYNQKIIAIINYINGHLTQDLSIDHLASAFYISRYYLMRMFKAETGYTIGSYITSKRLALAREKILSGIPLTQLCFDCGFKDYSTFLRAYKKEYGEKPGELRKNLY